MRCCHFTLRSWLEVRSEDRALPLAHVGQSAPLCPCVLCPLPVRASQPPPVPASPPALGLRQNEKHPSPNRPATSCISCLQPLVYSGERRFHVSLWLLAPVGRAMEATGQWRVGGWDMMGNDGSCQLAQTQDWFFPCALHPSLSGAIIGVRLPFYRSSCPCVRNW